MGLPQVLRRHDGRLTVVLGKHVLSFLTLAMASVPDNGQAHGLIFGIAADKLLKCRRK